jgi:hypothetical protein
MSEDRNGQDLPEPEDELDQEVEEEPTEDSEEPEPLETEPEEAPAEPPRRERGGRANERIRQLNRERNELRERLARLEGQVSVHQAPQQPQVSQAELDRQEAEQLQLMSPDQQARYFSQKTERAVSQALLQHQVQTADQIDRLAFDRFCERYPAAERLTRQVEDVLAGERRAGRNPSRETVVKYLLGDELLKRGTRAAGEQRRTGRQRIAREQSRPGNARSTAAPQGRSRSNGEMSDADFIDAFERQHGDTPLW